MRELPTGTVTMRSGMLSMAPAACSARNRQPRSCWPSKS